MGRPPIKVSVNFVVKTDHKGVETEVIYNPPLMAESQNIRVELRIEHRHPRPHVHVIKKGKDKSYDVSIALDDLEILAGENNLKHFDRKEFQAIAEFISENQDRFKEIYETLRGNL
jgi:hypothetical protein